MAHEEPRRVVPARVERYPARAAREHIAAWRFSFRQESELQFDAQPEPGHDVGVDRKASVRRADRVLELGIEEALVPEKIGMDGQWRPAHMCERGVIALERAIREDRNPRLAHRGNQKR